MIFFIYVAIAKRLYRIKFRKDRHESVTKEIGKKVFIYSSITVLIKETVLRSELNNGFVPNPEIKLQLFQTQFPATTFSKVPIGKVTDFQQRTVYASRRRQINRTRRITSN